MKVRKHWNSSRLCIDDLPCVHTYCVSLCALLHIHFSKESFLVLCNHNTGGEAEVLPAHVKVLHYGVVAGPPPAIITNIWSLASAPAAGHSRHTVPGAEPVGMLQSVVGGEEAEGRIKTPLLPDSKSMPVTNLNTEVTG